VTPNRFTAGLALLFCAAVAAAAPLAPARVAPLLDAQADQVLQRIDVPSTAQKVGEVRLVRRGAYDVVQTLLNTKLLSRAVGEIRKKELAAWPADQPSHDDAMQYATALGAAQKEIWQRMPRDARVPDRRQQMWIEFVLGASTSVVAVGTFGATPAAAEEIASEKRETLAVLDLSRDYVRRNMRLIAADSFHVDGAALDALLAPLARLREADAKAPIREALPSR
jgi:hypothetical protein